MQALDWFGDRSLLVIDVSLACCAIEVDAAARGAWVEVTGSDRVAAVVAGTVTDAVLPHVQQIVADHDAKVVSFGVCASSGGPYWDSYAVTKGIGQVLDVDVFVPGCPPTPEALHEALLQLRT